MNLLLIGLRGAGKTTIGRSLAARRAEPFLDLDDATLAVLRAPTVADAWNRLGQPAFRAAEVEALSAALARSGRVIALGGGTPTAPGAADLIEAQRRAGLARVVYLRCDATTLRARLVAAPRSAGQHRPSLTGADPLDEIESVLHQRDPLYLRLADAVITPHPGAPGSDVDSVVDAIEAALARLAP